MKVSVLAALASCVLLTIGLAATADASIRKATNIPAESLSDALRTLAKDRQFEILYRAEVVRDVRTEGAMGEFTPEEALKAVLSGTGLSYKYLDANTVTVFPQSSTPISSSEQSSPTSSASGESNTTEVGKKSSQDFRMAQVDQNPARSPTVAQVNQNSTSSQSGGPALTEIVVTAQKRPERLQDVPISVVALTATDLQQRQITELDQLQFAVPGMEIESTGWQRRIQLRGISNGQGLFPLIGLYLDEAPVNTTGSSQIDLNPYDLDRIEVLRGPQGTLYGEGSAGGTIRFITKNPDLDSFGGNLETTAAFTPDGAPSQRLNAVVNVPVIGQELAFRVVGTFDHEGGWIDQPAVQRNNFNEQNLTDVRIKGLWQPVSELTVNAMAVIHRNDESTNIGEDANGNYSQVLDFTTTPVVKDYYSIYDLTTTYDFGSVRALNTASYVNQDRQARNFGFLDPSSPGVTVYQLYFDPYEPINKIFTDEFRLSSTASGPWQWTLGGIYRHAQLDLVEQLLFGAPGPASGAVSIDGSNSTLSKSWAAFGDTSYKLWERLRLGVGLRYFKDDQTYTAANTIQSGSFQSTDPRAYADFALAENLNLYASAAKGFRSGGFNSLDQPSYGPESIWTYEFGAKMSALNGHLTNDAAIFYSNYTDYQVVGEVEHLNITTNAGNAHIKGVEDQFSVRPWDQWTFGLTGDYIDAKFYEITAMNTGFTVGQELPFVPRDQFAASAQRDFEWYGRGGFVRVDYDVMGRQVYKNGSLGPLYAGESDVIHLLNLNATLRYTDKVSMAFFAQNLLNDRGFVDPYTFNADAARARPLTLGVQFNVTF